MDVPSRVAPVAPAAIAPPVSGAAITARPVVTSATTRAAIVARMAIAHRIRVQRRNRVATKTGDRNRAITTVARIARLAKTGRPRAAVMQALSRVAPLAAASVPSAVGDGAEEVAAIIRVKHVTATLHRQKARLATASIIMLSVKQRRTCRKRLPTTL